MSFILPLQFHYFHIPVIINTNDHIIIITMFERAIFSGAGNGESHVLIHPRFHK